MQQWYPGRSTLHWPDCQRHPASNAVLFVSLPCEEPHPWLVLLQQTKPDLLWLGPLPPLCWTKHSPVSVAVEKNTWTVARLLAQRDQKWSLQTEQGRSCRCIWGFVVGMASDNRFLKWHEEEIKVTHHLQALVWKLIAKRMFLSAVIPVSVSLLSDSAVLKVKQHPEL